MLNATVEAMIAYVALLAVLVAYALLISIDIGVGFYYWLAGVRIGHAPIGAGRHEAHEAGGSMRDDDSEGRASDDASGGRATHAGATPQAIQRVTEAYLSPVWEVTNVFFILFVVGMIGFFPSSARIFGTALLVPVSLATIALIVRGAALAFHHAAEGTARWFARALTPIFGLAGLLVPALLVTFLSSSESGAIQAPNGAQGTVVIAQALLWLSPLQLTLAALAVVVALYLGAVALASFAAQRGEWAVARWYRRAALWSGGAAGALALAFGAALAIVAPFHAAALLAQWPALLLTVALFGASLWALAVAPTHAANRKGRAARYYGLAAWAALTQVALALGVFMLTRAPYLLYPSIRLADAVTPPATFTALSVTVVVGLLFVIPSLGLLYALFLRAPAVATPAQQPQPASVGAAVAPTAGGDAVAAALAAPISAEHVTAEYVTAEYVAANAGRRSARAATHYASHARRIERAPSADARNQPTPQERQELQKLHSQVAQRR
ncbi:MAG TPA: cytochrome d ubiquinol oxidase subunit II [Ktedonobacterales bacterium]|nr:cytochrome d ubiquinol oxidase subunit II [Ktedonobacterales bacterium]